MRQQKCGSRAEKTPPRGSQPRFRLRDVGAGDLAGGEAVARLPQRHLEHVHVAALKLEDGRGLQQFHVGSGGVEERILLAVSNVSRADDPRGRRTSRRHARRPSE
jgi:hypothetical protein